MTSEVASIRELAELEKLGPRYIRRLLPLANLAPEIVESILDGHQPASLTLDKLYRLATANWSEQSQFLNITSSS